MNRAFIIFVFFIEIIVLSMAERINMMQRFSRTFNSDLNSSWEDFKQRFGKTYDREMEIYRRLVWEENVKKIHQHNLQYDLGKHSYTLGINAMSDLTFEEFRRLYLPGLGINKNDVDNKTVTFLPPLNLDAVPDTVDWRKDGYVTEVKNQGACGSCWSFSTTGALEGQYYRLQKKLVSFSEQQLVDCSRSFGPEGCNGGWPEEAYNYIAKAGIEEEKDYPYTAKDGKCRYSADRVVTKVKGSAATPPGDEIILKKAVATEGPISVCINAGNPSFFQYKSGVYDEPACTKELDHAVLIVGYGKSEDGKDYWLVKNSWGTSWGVNGYVYMSRNKKNQCGIAEHCRYPLL